jgi:hypothetical protein
MKKHLFAIGMTAAVLVSGCDAALTGAVNTALQNQQGKPQTPASTVPTTPASANPAVPAGSDPFIAGRKWTYTLATKAAGLNTGGELTIEVAKVDATTATIRTTSSIAGATTSNETTVNRTGHNAWASMNIGGGTNGSTPTATANETVTVAAGTFACTKLTYTTTSATGNGTVDIWLNQDKGMVKEIVTIKPTVAASLPAGLPGLSLDMTVTTTIELKTVMP